MSYFDYLSCSRELPVGSFGKSPKAIYPSYHAYKASPDYVVPRDAVTGEPPGDQEDGITVRLQGNVVVYATFEDYHGVFIRPFQPIVTIEGRQVICEDVTPQFSLPHLYHVSFNRTVKLEEYLCKYLQPGDKAELFTCWAGDESKERDRKRDRVIDLQWVLDTNGWTEEHNAMDEGFTLYVAPKAPAPEIHIHPLQIPDHAFSVIQEAGLEAYNLNMAFAQGVGP